MPETACGFKSRSSHHTFPLRRVLYRPRSTPEKSTCHSHYSGALTSAHAIFVTANSSLSIFDQKGRYMRSTCSVKAPQVHYLRAPHSRGMVLAVPLIRSMEMIKKPDTSIRLLTLAEAASILKISKRTLHRMIQNRQIPAFKVGGQWRILESRFQEWVQEEESTAPKAS